jgi:hypothetical protein
MGLEGFERYGLFSSIEPKTSLELKAAQSGQRLPAYKIRCIACFCYVCL